MAAPAREVPRWVLVVTIAAVALVALVAAVASYAHVHTLAERAGEGWRAYLSPLSVDGLLVAASMVMLVRRRAGLPAGALPWVGLVLGLGASLAANVAAAHPEWRTPWLDGVVSAWPAVALAISFELLILVVRESAPAAEQPAAPPATVESAALNSESRPGRVEPPAPAPDVPNTPADMPTGIPTGMPAPAGKPRPQRTAAEKQAAAERSARSRRHKTGDHTLCLPGRCPDAPRVRAA